MIRGAPLPNTYRMGLLARNARLRVAYPLASDGPQDGDERDSDGNFYEGKCALALLSISHSRNYSKSGVDLSSPIFALPTPLSRCALCQSQIWVDLFRNFRLESGSESQGCRPRNHGRIVRA